MNTKASSTAVNQNVNVNAAFVAAKYVELGLKDQAPELFILFTLNPEFKVPMNLIIGSYCSEKERNELAELGLLDDKSKVKELHKHNYVQAAINLFNEEKTWYMEKISNVTVPEGEAVKIEFDSADELDDKFGLIAVLLEVMARAATQKRVTTIDNKSVEFVPQLDEAKVLEILSAVDAEGNPDSNSFINLCEYIATEGGLVEVTPQTVEETTEEPVAEATTEAIEQVANIETVATTEQTVEEAVTTEPENNPAMTEPIMVSTGLTLTAVGTGPLESELKLLQLMHTIDSEQFEQLTKAANNLNELNEHLVKFQQTSNELQVNIFGALKAGIAKQAVVTQRLNDAVASIEEIKKSLAASAEVGK